jgi:hypothetical protein
MRTKTAGFRWVNSTTTSSAGSVSGTRTRRQPVRVTLPASYIWHGARGGVSARRPFRLTYSQRSPAIGSPAWARSASCDHGWLAPTWPPRPEPMRRWRHSLVTTAEQSLIPPQRRCEAPPSTLPRRKSISGAYDTGRRRHIRQYGCLGRLSHAPAWRTAARTGSAWISRLTKSTSRWTPPGQEPGAGTSPSRDPQGKR